MYPHGITSEAAIVRVVWKQNVPQGFQSFKVGNEDGNGG